MSTKAELRSELSAQRRALDIDWMNEASSRILENLQKSGAFSAAKTVALYKALPGEVQLENLFSICWNLGKETCIPVFNPNLRVYEMAAVDRNTRYETGNYGVVEPRSPSLVELNRIDLIVVPGVAFDIEGNRLGRGGGYYDRFLDGFCGVTAAVAFEFQIFPAIPHEVHDRSVNYIVTESKIVDVCNEH